MKNKEKMAKKKPISAEKITKALIDYKKKYEDEIAPFVGHGDVYVTNDREQWVMTNQL
jgi:hypothetical protein